MYRIVYVYLTGCFGGEEVMSSDRFETIEEAKREAKRQLKFYDGDAKTFIVWEVPEEE